MLLRKLTQQQGKCLIAGHTRLAIAAITLWGTFSVAAQAAGDSAQIQVRGKVLANTCVIDDNSATQTVDLPAVSDRDLAGNTITGEKIFTIRFNDCGSSVGKLLITASGRQDSNNNQAFANVLDDAGGAKGVAVYVYQTDGKTLFEPSGKSTETYTLTPSVSNNLTFKAAYVGTLSKVTAGEFCTTVNMTFNYI